MRCKLRCSLRCLIPLLYRRKLISVFLIMLSTNLALAQLPLIPRAHDDWQTIHTEHFNVHYPVELETWSKHAAKRMESIHSRVTDYIGYDEIDHPMNVIIMDPLGLPNGMAIPFLGQPRIILWPNAPVTPLMLGGLETWSEILMIHEYAHAVHLTRRPRSRKGKMLSRLAPIGPVSLKLPLWAIEGYAVLIESELTGHGRVNSSSRSMVLTQLAVEGKLPEYSTLNGDQWLSGRYPYLVGSAFLEWLINQSGNPDALVHLWKRLTARTDRSFEDAFTGVFQNTPQNLYARFRAELTAEGLKLEKHLLESGGIIEGENWQHFDGITSEPAVSSNGEKMAVVVRQKNKPSTLHILCTEQTQKEKPDPALDDPDDVPALPIHPPKRKKLHSFVSRNGIVPASPRFMPDGKSILFHALRKQPDGDYRFDIYQWFFYTNSLNRLTKGESLSWVDPSNDGTFAVALRQNNGFSEIVRLDLKTGAITSITKPTVESIWQNPRLSPDDNTLATVRRANNRSELVLICLKTNQKTVIPSDKREVILYPTWMPDGNRILYCTDRSGIINLEMITVDGFVKTQVTQSLSGVLAPEPASDDQNGYFFLKPHAEGMNIHYAARHQPVSVLDASSRFSWTLPPSSPDVPSPPEIQAIPSPEPYRATQNLEFSASSAYTHLPYMSYFHWGLRSGDIIGRFHTMAAASFAENGGPRGGMIAAAYRGWPFHITVKGFYEKESPERQRLISNLEIRIPDTRTYGIDASVSKRFHGTNWQFDVKGGGAWAQTQPNSADHFDRILTGLDSNSMLYGNRGRLSYGMQIGTSLRTGKTDSESWSQAELNTTVYSRWNQTAVKVKYSEGHTYGNPAWPDLFHMGGVTGSIQSEWLHKNRLQIPWLPSGTHLAHRYSKTNIQLLFGREAPMAFFISDVRIWSDQPQTNERVAGAEWNFSLPYIPLLRLSSIDLTTGVAYGLYGSIESKWRGYLVTGIFL